VERSRPCALCHADSRCSPQTACAALPALLVWHRHRGPRHALRVAGWKHSCRCLLLHSPFHVNSAVPHKSCHPEPVAQRSGEGSAALAPWEKRNVEDRSGAQPPPAVFCLCGTGTPAGASFLHEPKSSGDPGSGGLPKSAPEARRDVSPGRKPWVGEKNDRSPGGAAHGFVSRRMFFVSHLRAPPNCVRCPSRPRFIADGWWKSMDHSPGVPGKPGFGLLGWRRPRLCLVEAQGLVGLSLSPD